MSKEKRVITSDIVYKALNKKLLFFGIKELTSEEKGWVKKIAERRCNETRLVENINRLRKSTAFNSGLCTPSTSTYRVATVHLVKEPGEEDDESGQESDIIALKKSYPDIINHLRRGDLIENVTKSGYRSEGVYMFDGSDIIPLYYNYDEYGSIPIEFKMFRDFHPRYWDEVEVNDRYAPGETSKFYWHGDYAVTVLDNNVIRNCIKSGGLHKIHEDNELYYRAENYVIVNYESEKYAVLLSDEYISELNSGKKPKNFVMYLHSDKQITVSDNHPDIVHIITPEC